MNRKELLRRIIAEVEKEVNEILDALDAAREGEVVEKVEFLARRLMLRAGGRILQLALKERGQGYLGSTIPCSCGGRMKFVRYLEKTFDTVVCSVTLKRAYYRCSRCGRSRIPLDEELGFNSTHRSPGVERILTLAGMSWPFQAAVKVMKELAEIRVTRKSVERVTESLGSAALELRKKDPILPPVKRADGRRFYGTADGTMVNTTDGWKEVKVGAFYDQEKDEKRYFTSFSSALEFGEGMRRAGARVGVWESKEFIFIGDGAPWIWNMCRINFPFAEEVVDFYHAAEKVWGCGRELYGEGTQACAEWSKELIDVLKNRGAKEAIEGLDPEDFRMKRKKEAVASLRGYFDNNLSRMNYPSLRGRGIDIGSGPVESACKTLVGARLKGAGMRWKKENADGIAALRSLYLSDARENFWLYKRRIPN